MSVEIEAFTGRSEEILLQEEMDPLTIVIWVVTGLGILVLILCIILAFLLVYQQCRKLKFGVYSPVTNHIEAGGEATVTSYTSLQSPSKNGHGGDEGQIVINVVNEKATDNADDITDSFISSTLRLFKRKNADVNPSEFSAEDFKVPVQKISGARRVAFNPRISRSDWDIHDYKQGGGREEIELLLSRDSKDLSIRSKLSNEYKEEEDFKSQYFDAQESLSDDEGKDDNEKDENFEDIEDEDENETTIQRAGRRRYSTSLHIKHMKSLPKSVQRRVSSLKVLMLKQKQLESSLYRDIHKLEARYYSQQHGTTYNSRRRLVEGQQSHPTILEEEGEEDETLSETNSIVEQGVPGFWLRVLLNSKNLRQIVQASDIPVLSKLVDIRVSNFEEPLLGFRLTFFFRPCDQFTDTELTKDYFLKTEPGDEENPLTFQGPEVVGCQGCKIHWKRHQNLTIRPLKRVQNHKIVTKWARKNSFFNFFNPPKVGAADEVHHLKRRQLLEAHYELGLFFKEQVIPKAFLFFTRTGYDGSSTPKSVKQNKLRLKSSSKANTPVGPKTPQRKPSDDVAAERTLDTESVIKYEKVELKEDEEVKKFVAIREDINENIVQDISEDVLMNQINSTEDPTDILESVSNPEKDAFPGRYLMESSEGFDEWMKAMGVGLIKRRLANSVVPINEMEISPDGVYIFRTLTSVRNSEISFRLDEPFLEDTLDGRKTQSTAKRMGNMLVIDQIGDKSRGDKDTQMTREVDGDVLTVKLILGDVVCTRIYQRMQD